MKNVQSHAKDVTTFFLLLAFVFGLAVRLYPLFKTDFPLVDGGMFYSMIMDLRASNFTLPAFTSYNQANIPFAYPPLGFYLAGLLNLLTNISVLDILRWLPVSITVLNIPLFYLLSKNILDSGPKAALATLIFTLTPNSYWWNIVGGGLTRSLGTLLFTTTVLCVYQMYRRRSRFWVVAAVFSAAGVVLSHPAWAVQSAVVSVVLWYFFGRDRQGILYSVIVAAGVLLLTSPWWINIIQEHGVGTLLNAGQGTYSRLKFWTVFFTLSFTDEYTPVIAVFGLCGLFMHAAKKDYFPIVWVFLCLFVEPRGGIAASIFPFSIMAATVLSDGIASRLVPENIPSNDWMDALKFNSGRFFFGFFILLFTYNAFQVSDTLSHQVLNPEERQAIEWISLNTNSADRFLVLDQESNPLHSPLTEWFPALAERQSIATIQGTEWLSGKESYVNQYDTIAAVQQCIYSNMDCVYKLQSNLPDDYDYIMLSVAGGQSPLIDSLNNSSDFSLVYSTDSVKIYQTE
ncbi:MAG: hypothetical protein IPO36_05030 [Anaerolineales bacterium]|nr:hypothetical protein [Anaerolineales bacterium]